MLQMFVDDSGINQPPIYCLCGWIATSEQWALFSHDWKVTLEESPSIPYFHAVEWRRLGGAFRGWKRLDADLKLDRLIAVISKHKLVMSCSVMLHDHYIEVFGGESSARRKFPAYQILLNHIVLQTCDWLKSKGVNQKIEFIFDEQSGHDKIVLSHWDALRQNTFDDIQAIIAPNPSFRNDQEVVGIQAADLLAWTVRRSNENQFRKLPAPLDIFKYREDCTSTYGVINIMTKLSLVNIHLVAFYKAMISAGIYSDNVLIFNRKLLRPANCIGPKAGSDQLPDWKGIHR